MIDERRSDTITKKQNSVERIDILQHMINEGNRPDTGFPMCNRDIIDQMSELLLAGSETTSGTLLKRGRCMPVHHLERTGVSVSHLSQTNP